MVTENNAFASTASLFLTGSNTCCKELEETNKFDYSFLLNKTVKFSHFLFLFIPRIVIMY